MDLLNSWMICIIANLLFAIHSIGTYENIQFAKVILCELNIMFNSYDKSYLYILVYDYSLTTDNIGIRFVFIVKFLSGL